MAKYRESPFSEAYKKVPISFCVKGKFQALLNLNIHTSYFSHVWIIRTNSSQRVKNSYEFVRDFKRICHIRVMCVFHISFVGSRWPSLIFLVIASPQKLLDRLEWNLPVVFASMPASCAIQKKKNPVRRQLWPYGSRLGLNEISHWQAWYRISSKTTGRIILDLDQNVPLNV